MAILESVGRKIYHSLRLLERPSLLSYRLTGGDIDTYLKLNQKWFTDYGFNTVLDIGASEGSFSKAIAEVFPNIKIFAFEPIPMIYKILTDNMVSNTNFTSYNCGLGNDEGKVDFNLNASSTSSSFLSQDNQHKDAFPETSISSETIQVKVNKLDRLIKRSMILFPLFVKIVVQGFERDVLNGGSQIIQQAEVILIEMSFVELYKGQALFPEIYSILVDWGYDYAGDIFQHSSKKDGRILQCDSVFLRR